MPIIKCEQCGKERNRSMGKITRAKHNFCCRECAYLYRKKYNQIEVLNEMTAYIICEDRKILIDKEDLSKVNHIYWLINNWGYCVGWHKTKSVSIHRLIMNCPENLVVDHINHNPLDNRKSNLRICTQLENMQNLKPRKQIA